MASETIICSVCGAKNPAKKSRCDACGAKLESLGSLDLSAEERQAKRYQQDGFSWKWVVGSFSIYIVLQAIALAALPAVIDSYDPQGLWGLVISAGIWFIGGVVVGAISPGKTFIEPSVGAAVAVLPTVAWLIHISDVREVSQISYLIFGALGVMMTLIGALIGEKIQIRREDHTTH